MLIFIFSALRVKNILFLKHVLTLYYWVKTMDTKLNIINDEKITQMIAVILAKYDKEYHEDLRQELILKSLEIINKQYNVKSFESYLFVVLKNHAIKYMKEETHRNNYVEFNDMYDHKTNISSFDNALLENLSKLEKDIFVLYFIYGYTKKETARMLNIYPKKITLIINKIVKKISSFHI